jgi:energy-coupling factor transporter ATP-binding protein EcfA2
MTIEEDICTWAATRPAWQQEALRVLAQGGTFDDAAVQALADKLIEGHETAVPPLTAEEISGVQSPGVAVLLSSIADPTNVNRLLDEQKLTFAPQGLTVVYGDNASGKSGYARIIKAVVGARHREAIHPDVFSDPSSVAQSALIAFDRGGFEQTATWPSGEDSALRSIHFYDEPCGDDYLGGETELTYRPSALALLDSLISLCDALHAALDERLRESDAGRNALPTVPAASPASQFVAELRGTTSAAELAQASLTPSDLAKQQADLAREEVRLQATNPEAERTRVEKLLAAVKRVESHVNDLGEKLRESVATDVVSARDKATQLRAAADMASSTTFDDEPLSGVGSQTWRALWEAARSYSEAEAYPGESFPRTSGDSHCVLCQQALDPGAVDRFSRFHAYLHDTTEQQARAAEHALQQLTAQLTGLTSGSAQMTTFLMEIGASESTLAANVSAWLASADERKSALLAHLSSGVALDGAPLAAPPSAELAALTTRLTADVAALDAAEFQKKLSEITARKDDLRGRELLSEHKAAIEAEIKRLGARDAIQQARRATDTTGITRKSTELTRSHVTTLVRDRFTRETDRLDLQRVTLSDIGGQKGKLRHRPSLLGAKVPRPVDEVLSEGEQTALGVAGYFTECHFDESDSAMVLDDPVSSLDHIRRGHVARRLAQFAKTRQVIVFSHDIIFVGELTKAAEAESVSFTERCVERRGDGRTGVCVDHHVVVEHDLANGLDKLLRRGDRGSRVARDATVDAAQVLVQDLGVTQPLVLGDAQ